jgi:hypothetical protein
MGSDMGAPVCGGKSGARNLSLNSGYLKLRTAAAICQMTNVDGSVGKFING